MIFSSPTGQLRDPSNPQVDLRGAMDRLASPWVTSRTVRKTVASQLDDEGFSIRHIADTSSATSDPRPLWTATSAGGLSSPLPALTP